MLQSHHSCPPPPPPPLTNIPTPSCPPVPVPVMLAPAVDLDANVSLVPLIWALVTFVPKAVWRLVMCVPPTPGLQGRGRDCPPGGMQWHWAPWVPLFAPVPSHPLPPCTRARQCAHVCACSCACACACAWQLLCGRGIVVDHVPLLGLAAVAAECHEDELHPITTHTLAGVVCAPTHGFSRLHPHPLGDCSPPAPNLNQVVRTPATRAFAPLPPSPPPPPPRQ